MAIGDTWAHSLAAHSGGGGGSLTESWPSGQAEVQRGTNKDETKQRREQESAQMHVG